MKQKFFLLTFFAIFFFAVFAQDKKAGVITGYVKNADDKSPLADAVVTLGSDAFKGRRFAVTNASGKYVAKHLPAGTYTLMFEMEGFKTYTQHDVVVSPGKTVEVNFEMKRDTKAAD